MVQIRKILFPIVFCQTAAALASSVKEMAQRFNASVIVLNAFNPVPEYAYGPAPGTPCDSNESSILFSPALMELRNQQERRLEKFAHELLSGTHHTERIVDGDPVTVIEWVANCEDIDLVMMPTRGLGRFHRFMIASVTSKVLHDVACPVWTSIHAPEWAAASPSEIRLIVCATAMNPEETTVLETASLFVKAFGSNLCLLNVQPSSNRKGELCTPESLRHAFDRVCRAAGVGVSTDVCAQILNAEKSEEVSRIACEQSADLVIISRGCERGCFSRAFSRLNTIIRESPCPVLSV